MQKVVLDPISGHDLSRHADPVSAVYCKSDCYVGRESPQDIGDFLSSPDPPAALWRRLLGRLLSLTPLVKGGMLCIRCSRFASGPGGTSETSSSTPLGILSIGDPLWWSWAIQRREDVRPFSPSARLELLLGRVRRQLGRPRRGNPSVGG